MNMYLPNNNQEESSEKKSKFIKKSNPRTWEVELTKEQRENLKKALRTMKRNMKQWQND